MARTPKTKVLTALAVKKYVNSPASGDLHDGGGLYLRKRQSSCWWYLRLKSPATQLQTWFKLFPDDPNGAYPQKSLEQARQAAEAVWSQKSAGLDPRLERLDVLAKQKREAAERIAQAADALKNSLTMRALFDKWQGIELAVVTVDGKRRSGRKDSGELVKRQLNLHVFSSLGEKPVSAVTRGDIMAVLDTIRMSGKNRTTNSVLSHLKQMYRFAIVRELVDKDPTNGLSKARHGGGNDVERDRALSEAEIQQLAVKVTNAGLSSRTIAVIWILLATLCRISELMLARWSDVDLVNRQWRIPPENTKNGKEHIIFLSDFTLSWFKFLNATREVSEWVLPGRDLERPLNQKTINKQIHDRQTGERAPLKGRSAEQSALALPGGNWTPHDLRRTGATLMSHLGVFNEVIHLCQNHTPEEALTRIYIQNQHIEGQKKAFEMLGARLNALVNQTNSPLSNLLKTQTACIGRSKPVRLR